MRRTAASLHVGVTTHNQSQNCLLLLQDIQRDAASFRLRVTVLDNGSTENYQAVRKFLRARGWRYIRIGHSADPSLAFNQLLSLWSNDAADYFYYLRDGLRLCSDFFNRTTDLWRSMAQPDKVALYLHRDGPRDRVGTECWTGFASRVDGVVEKTQWVGDKGFLGTRDLVQALDTGLHGEKSIGEQISRQMHARKRGMYRALESCVVYQEGTTTRFIDGPEVALQLSQEYYSAPPKAEPPKAEPPKPGKKPVGPPKQAKAPPAKRTAAFLVATHHRPRLLEASLQHLAAQKVPDGWGFQILVSGKADDSGQAVVAKCRGARFIPCTSDKDTDKLNLLAKATSAELLLMADDDDLQPLDRLAVAIQAYEQGAGWSASGPHRFFSMTTGQMARWDGKASRGLVGTSVSVSRQIFMKANGYPSVDSGKDGRLAARIRRTSPQARFKDISNIGDGLICIQHASNINRRPFPAKGVKTAKGWFSIVGQGHWATADLPDFARDTLMGLHHGGEVRVGSLATIPSRVGMLQQVVKAVLPQVDRLNVYLNGFHSVPGFLQQPKITVVRSQDHGDHGDAGKFFWVDDVDGYHISFDDDVHYPPDTVDRLVRAVDHYGRRVAVAFHGAVIAPNPWNYYRSRTVYHCTQAVAADIPVHVLGTGSMCFHTGYMQVSRDDFPEPNMADIWFAMLGQQQKVPFLTLQRPKKYIVPMPVKDSIFGSSRSRDLSRMDTAARQTELVRGQEPWHLHKPSVAEMPSEALSVAIFTYNRPDSLLALLRDLIVEREVHPMGLAIRIYDDASTEDYSQVRAFARSNNIRYFRATTNHGKAHHAHWVSRAFQDNRLEAAGLFAFLPDDVRLLPGGLFRAMKLWESIDDPKKATLSLAVCSGRESVPCWTGVPPRQFNEDVWYTGWVDGLFLCDRRTMEVLKYRIPPFRPNHNPNFGSGMGRSMSKGLMAGGWSMYRVAQSVVADLPDAVIPSRMNTSLRRANPIHMLHPFNEPPTPAFEVTPMVLGSKTLQFHVFANDHIGRIVKAGYLYESILLEEIRRRARRGLYLDIGAFIGTHTAFFAEMCPSTFVVAVEANPDHYALLRRNIQVNKLNAFPVFGALLEGSARATSLPADPNNRGMAQTVPGGSIIAYGLAEMLAFDIPVAVIKIDVEGHEPEVLHSGAVAIAQSRPLIIAEAPTKEAIALIEKELPPRYTRSPQYNATPTYIWSPQ